MDDLRQPLPACVPRHLGAVMFAAMLALGGCEHLGVSKKFKNPVCPPPPTRVANLVDDSDSEDKLASADEGGVAWVSASEDGKSAVPLPNGEVAATVNGSPIFVDDVLGPFKVPLMREARQRSPAEMESIRQELVRRHLRHHIEREVLVQSLKVKMKEDQMKGLDAYLDKEWQAEETDMIKKLRVNTRAELDAELRKQGNSLAEMKATFKNQKMAQQYLSIKSAPKEKLGRPELLAHYNEHIADYEFPAQVKWRQIEIPSSEHGGPKKTLAFARQLVLEIRTNRRDFGEAARKYSNGATAKKGGEWEWTKKGSIAWENVDEALFEMEVGEVSDPLPTPQGYQIVQVVERKDAGRRPFDEVHEDIAEAIRKDQFRAAAGDTIDTLVEQADVKFIYGATPEAGSEATGDVVPAAREEAPAARAQPKRNIRPL